MNISSAPTPADVLVVNENPPVQIPVAAIDDQLELAKIGNRLMNRLVLKEGQELTAAEIRFCITKMMSILKEESMSLLEVDQPIVVCGDMHGQYEDLLRIMKRLGWPPKTHYLFLGDYVDRGPCSIETICTIFVLKAAFPKQFFVLRGNHETRDINRLYGFHEECERRFAGENIWDEVNDVFSWLPLAAIVGKRIFCTHGGIPRDLESFDKIREIKLPTDCPESGIISDLLWSDPADSPTCGFVVSGRGQGHLFGVDALEDFCQRLEIDLVCRAHQVHYGGYRFFGDERLITIFTAPNYGGFNNDAACLIVDRDLGCRVEILHPHHRRKRVALPDAND